MLQAKFLTTYRSKKSGKLVGMFTVSGSPAELAAYKEAQGAYFRTDEDGTTPLIYGSPGDEGQVYNISYADGYGYFVDFKNITVAAGYSETVAKKGNALLADKVAELQARQLMGSGISTAAASAFDAETPQEPASKPKANLKNPVGS